MSLNKLIYEGKHGTEPSEKKTLQRFEINVELGFDFDPSIESDNMAHTIDWGELRDKIRQVVENESFNLVEALAGKIATILFEYEPIQQLKVTVLKLDIWDKNGYPGITIHKSR